MVKLLVELLGSSSKDLVINTLALTQLLMLKYEWRVSFATEGGVKAILSCMQEFSTVTQVQQLALAVRAPFFSTGGFHPEEIISLCCHEGSSLLLKPFVLTFLLKSLC